MMAIEEYELWNGETGNCVGSYASETAALADVAEDYRRNGQQAYELGLIGPTIEGSLSGKQLVDKALARMRHSA